jgi:hypothetical protein
MWSRAGKPIISAPHIFEALKPLFDKSPELILMESYIAINFLMILTRFDI